MATAIFMDFSFRKIVFAWILCCPFVNVASATFRCPNLCYCNPIEWQDGHSMHCSVEDSLVSFPLVTGDASRILKIQIRRQPRLTHLSGQDLRNYTGLQHLTVESTGLMHVADGTFSMTPNIEKIHFRQNKFQSFPRRPVILLNYNELWLDDNPLTCNCSNLWLGQDKAVQTAGAKATCMMADDVSMTTASNLTGARNSTQQNTPLDIVDLGQQYQQCKAPNVTMSPSNIEVLEGANITMTCSTATPGPLRLEFLGISNLNSWYDVVDEDEAMIKLEVRNITLSDHYKTVTCVSTSGQGSTRVDSRIHIYHPPKIMERRIKSDGDKLKTRLIVSGWPKPNVTWFMDGEVSLHGNHIWDFIRDRADERGYWKVYREFTRTTPAINGTYSFEASNSEGSTSNFSIFVQPLPGFEKEDAVHLWPYSNPRQTDGGQEQGTTANGTKPVDKEDIVKDLLMIVVPSVVGLIFVLATLLLAIFITRRRKRKSRVMGRFDLKAPFTYRKQDEFREVEPLTGVPMVENPNYEMRPKKIDKLKSKNFRHIKLETILLIQQIGEGAFGHVLLGKCAHLLKKNEFANVAVKTLKGDSEETIKRDFEKEAEFLATLHHPNIVTFYGVCTEGEQWMMLFEFMENGDLNNFLRSHGPHSAMLHPKEQGQPNPQLTVIQLLNIALQISQGMDYLASQHFVHRDLATRNCLVGVDQIVKIGDFGMSKDIYTTDYYKVGDAAMLPVRWMPPESIMYRTFTVKSDVWSFGVALWEVFTYGTQPWFEYSNLEVIDKIKTCTHLSKPSKCPDGLYNLMKGCWRENPTDRFTMKEIYRLVQVEMELLQPSYLDVIG